MSLIKCKECGREISEAAKRCPKCGFKIKREIFNKEKNRNIKLFTIISIIVVVLIVIGIICMNVIHNVKVKQYKEKYEEIVETIYSSSLEVEKCVSLYRNVWYNNIWDKDDEDTDKYTKDANGIFYEDFNDAIYALQSDSDFSKRISSIKEDNHIIESLFKDLKNPPKVMKEEYEDLEELIDIYLAFSGMVINPSGSLLSYSEKSEELDDKIVAAFKRVQRNIE